MSPESMWRQHKMRSNWRYTHMLLLARIPWQPVERMPTRVRKWWRMRRTGIVCQFQMCVSVFAVWHRCVVSSCLQSSCRLWMSKGEFPNRSNWRCEWLFWIIDVHFTCIRVTLAALSVNVVQNAMATAIVHRADLPVSTVRAKILAWVPVALAPTAICAAWHQCAAVRVTWPAIRLSAAVHSPKMICAARIHVARMLNACPDTTTPAKNVQCAPVCPATPVIRSAIVCVANARATASALTIVRASTTRALIRVWDNAVRMPFARLAVIWPPANVPMDGKGTPWFHAVSREASLLPDTTRRSRRARRSHQQYQLEQK